MLINVNTGSDAWVDGAQAVDAADLGVRFSSFRSLDRFDQQLDGIKFGMVSWPGGYLAEANIDRFGLNFDGLYNPSFGQPGLSEMIDFANAHDAGISIVLPTVRYDGNEALMRAEVRGFMTDLLSGTYGALPEKVILHIGSEYYDHFAKLFGADAASHYGDVASNMVNEINACLSDPALNPNGVEIDVSVQAGRSLVEDEDIREAFSAEDLASVDLVMHHRYPGFAEGIDYTLNQFSPIFEAWKADVVEAGGDAPELHLSEWNVASVTRDEGLTKYIRDMKADGITINRSDVDLDGRTDTDFETYWQNLLATRDYGIEQPRLYLELFSEYQAEGMGAASLHAWDMVHAGRATFTDADGNPVQFVGGTMIEMLYESVEGLTVMDISTENSRNSDLWTYGFENDDRLVMFLSANEDATVGEVTLDIEGLGDGYQAIWVEGLTAHVPEDWMARFGVIDNPDVDETPEGNTYALGMREDLPFALKDGTLTFSIDEPGETVRVIVARTPEEALKVAEWAGPPDQEVNGTVMGTLADQYTSGAELFPEGVSVSEEGAAWRDWMEARLTDNIGAVQGTDRLASLTKSGADEAAAGSDAAPAFGGADGSRMAMAKPALALTGTDDDAQDPAEPAEEPAASDADDADPLPTIEVPEEAAADEETDDSAPDSDSAFSASAMIDALATAGVAGFLVALAQQLF